MNHLNRARQLVDDIIHEYENITLSFSGPTYWNMIKLEYVRTVNDILTVTQKLREERDPDAPPLSILEIGAFHGIVSTVLRREGFKVTAMDIPLFMKDEALLQHYRKEDITPLACDLSHLPMPIGDEAFDIVIFCEVLEHLNFNPIPALADINRVLKKQGILYLGTPNHSRIVSRLRLARGLSIHNVVQDLVMQLDSNSDFSIGLHWREYTAYEVKELLVLTGFKMFRHYYCHQNDRSQSSFIRHALVSLMYRLFPAFLPLQVAISVKETACTLPQLALHSPCAG